MITHLSSNDLELLSAYLDGQLSAGEQKRLAQRMETQPELRRALEDLRRTRIMLRSAPRRRAPRNFTLTPQMVPQRRRSWFGLVPSLGFTSAAATISLIITLSLQFLPGLQAARMASPLPAASPAAALAPSAASKTQDNFAPSSGAPIIVWGSQGGQGGGGSGGGPPEASGLGGGPVIEPGQPAIEATQPAAMLALSGTPTPSVANASPQIQGTGPILGIRPPEERALIGITEVPTPDLPYAVQDQYQPALAQNPQPNYLSLDIVLGLLALATGAGAIFLRRRS